MLIHLDREERTCFFCIIRCDSCAQKKYFYCEKMQVSERSRVAGVDDPVVTTKIFKPTDATKKYEMVVASFQSASSCDIAAVNYCKECSFDAKRKECRTGISKFT